MKTRSRSPLYAAAYQWSWSGLSTSACEKCPQTVTRVPMSSPTYVAAIYGALGEIDEAFKGLEEAYEKA